MRITESSVTRRIATSVIVIALVVLGAYGLWKLPVNFLPDVTYPLVRVHIYWPGATPEEIDKNLADPIERQLASVEGLDYLESSAIEGMYTALVNFQYGVDVNVAYQDALAAMARAARNLPKDIEPPIVIKADPSQLPVVQLTVSSDQWDLVKLRTWTEDWLQDRLLAVPGVAGTEIVGGLKREIRVHLDPNALEKYKLSLAGVVKRLKDENVEQFGGRVTTGPREFIARTLGEFGSLHQIQQVILGRKDEGKVHIADVARVEDSHEEVRVITRLGSKPCVKLSVLKQADANTVEVAKAVNKRIQELQAALPAGIQLGMVENQAEYIEAALAGVRNAAIEGAILVILIVYVFLGSWRQAFVMALALPITMILNFGLMKVAGFSLNIFSLGGLVVAISVVLDNSIVVIENITRLKHETPSELAGTIAVKATAEVGPAIIAATLSFLAIFVPFLLVPGLVSLLFRELILVIAGVVTISLLTAITLAPMLTAILLGDKSAHGEDTLFQRFFSQVTEGYGVILSGLLRGRWIAVGVSALVLVGLAVVLPKVGTEFLPRMDDGRVMIKVRLPTGASVHETDKTLRRIEALIANDPLIDSYFTLVGGKVWGLYTYQIANEGEIDIQLIPRHKRKLSTKQYVERIRPSVAKIGIPGGMAMVMPMPVKGIRKLGDADIEVKIKGQEIEKLFELAQGTAGAMNKLAHFVNVYVSLDMTKPEYQILVDRKLSAELGVSIADVANTSRSLLQGAVATRYRDGDRYYNIRVVIPEREIKSKQDVENLILECSQGGYLRVRDLAEVRQAVGPVEIVREDQVKAVIVRGDAAGVTVGEALAELKDAIQKMERPVGYEFTFGGQALMMAEMKQTIMLILAFALFFAFVVLAVQFNSLKLPILILGCVPFCQAGLLYGLYLTGLPLGATVVIGALVVVAATVNEGVLLMTFAEDLRVRNRWSAVETVVAAAKIRLRPRLMTTIPIIMGLIPLALNIEEGGDMLQPMAVGAIGGLVMLVPVALFLMPCFYVIVTRETTISDGYVETG
ncbi:MAG: efflux RND transporter permease subunit [Desulfomonile sp.]|nr:efflux RND transporter permease subunit [Desulfomonile sp.]